VNVDSYSAFFDNNKARETPLRNLLRQNDITHNFICGVATDVCVNYTAFDSFECGFAVSAIEQIGGWSRVQAEPDEQFICLFSFVA